MLAAFKGKCLHCGRDDSTMIRGPFFMPVQTHGTLLVDGSSYLVIIDTGSLDAAYRYTWDVARWMSGSWFQHIRGTVTHFDADPLPSASGIVDPRQAPNPERSGPTSDHVPEHGADGSAAARCSIPNDEKEG